MGLKKLIIPKVNSLSKIKISFNVKDPWSPYFLHLNLTLDSWPLDMPKKWALGRLESKCYVLCLMTSHKEQTKFSKFLLLRGGETTTENFANFVRPLYRVKWIRKESAIDCAFSMSYFCFSRPFACLTFNVWQYLQKWWYGFSRKHFWKLHNHKATNVYSYKQLTFSILVV